MTLNTGETELVISTEYFADSLVDVQCDGDLILTFNSNQSFQDAIADWSWVNFAENRTFFMINNWGDCAARSDSGRQPWIVRNVDQYDSENFIVNFNATLSTWDVVGANSVIEFGSMPSTATKRDKTVSKDFSISLAHTLPQVFFSKSTQSGLDFSIGCPGCATTGSIKIEGKIVLSTFLGVPDGIKSISVSATPSGVGANLALGFDVSGTLGSGWQKDWTLFTVGLPGWSIPGIIDLGPEFTVDAGFSLSGINGQAEISAGINVAIPDSSSAVLGISGVDSSSNGWVPTVTPQTPKISVEVDGHLELYAEMGVDIGLTVLSKWGFGGGLFLRVPDIQMDLAAEFNTQGVCPGSKDVFGVTFDATVGVDLSLGVYTESGGNKDWKAKKPIYQNNNLITPIDKCFPLGPTLPASASGVSIKTVGTVPPSTSSTAKPTSSTSSKPSSTAVSTSKAPSGTGVSSTSKVSGTGVSSTSKVSGTGVSSSTKISGTGVSSSIHSYGTGVSSSTKISGTGVSSVTTKISGTGVSSAHPSGTGIASSSVKGASTSIASPPYATGASSSKKSSSTTTEGGYNGGYTTSSKPTGTAVSSKSTVTSVAETTYSGKSSSSSSAKSSVLGVETSGTKTSTSAYITTSPATTAKPTSTKVGSSTSKVLLGTSVTGAAPAPTQSGIISTCNKWVVIEDEECSCLNIETQYGVTASQLLSWNPALGAECKLIVGDAVCVGIKGGYKRAVNGRLARFVDA